MTPSLLTAADPWVASLRRFGLAVQVPSGQRGDDDFDDALAVVAGAPGTRFAATVDRFRRPSR